MLRNKALLAQPEVKCKLACCEQHLLLTLKDPLQDHQAWGDFPHDSAQLRLATHPSKQAAQLSAAQLAAVQETIGEVKMLRDEALQAQADAERKLARCEKQLREATDHLRSAQEVGVWQATWLEATVMAWLQPFLCRSLQQ